MLFENCALMLHFGNRSCFFFLCLFDTIRQLGDLLEQSLLLFLPSLRYTLERGFLLL